MSPAAITTTPGSGTGEGDGAIVGVGAGVGDGVGVRVATTVGIGDGVGVADGALHAASRMRRAAAGLTALRKMGAVPSRHF
jgi:hypothetical protein